MIHTAGTQNIISKDSQNQQGKQKPNCSNADPFLHRLDTTLFAKQFHNKITYNN